MNKAFTIITCMLLSYTTFAQKIEYSVQANSGVSYFRGPGAQSTTFIFEGNKLDNGYTYSVYGNQQQVSYGFGFDVKAVYKSNFFIGIQAGYDILRSRVNLIRDDRFLAFESFIGYYSPPIGGYSILTNQFINLNPYVGYRISVKQFYLDLIPGMDIGIGLHGHEKGQTQSNYGDISNYNNTATTDQNTDLPKQDYRARFDIKLGFKKIGITAGYAHGLTDYGKDERDEYNNPRYRGGPVYADVLRIGLSYRIN